MNNYTAAKPCNFGGVAYQIGDTIPAGVVNPSRVRSLECSGHIRAQSAVRAFVASEDQQGISIPVYSEKGASDDLGLQIACLSGSEIQEFFVIIQTTGKTVQDKIGQISSLDLLMLIDKFDTRKSIKEAAKSRARKLIAIADAEKKAAEAAAELEIPAITPDAKLENENADDDEDDDENLAASGTENANDDQNGIADLLGTLQNTPPAGNLTDPPASILPDARTQNADNNLMPLEANENDENIKMDGITNGTGDDNESGDDPAQNENQEDKKPGELF